VAIDTTNEKLGLMEWCLVWEPALPISPGALGQDDQQQLLWGYPGITWGAAASSGTRRQRRYAHITRRRNRLRR